MKIELIVYRMGEISTEADEVWIEYPRIVRIKKKGREDKVHKNITAVKITNVDKTQKHS